MHTESHISHDVLDGDVHVFVIEKASAHAVSEFLDGVVEVYDVLQPGEKARVLVDLRPDGLPPVNAAMRAGRRFARERDNQPEARFAYLHDSNPLISMAQTFLDILRIRSVKRRFFEDYDQAVAWLRSDT